MSYESPVLEIIDFNIDFRAVSGGQSCPSRGGDQDEL